jgi:hypothetical protein
MEATVTRVMAGSFGFFLTQGGERPAAQLVGCPIPDGVQPMRRQRSIGTERRTCCLAGCQAIQKLCLLMQLSGLCKSGGTYDNSLHLVRPTDPCLGKPRAIRRRHRAELAFGKLPDIGGSFPRLVRLVCPCFRKHVAIPRIDPVPGRHPLGPHPVRSE